MHYLYIIYSETIDKYYVGETPDLEIRINQHNNHYFKTSFTKTANDWKASLEYSCKTKEEALFLERFIKKMKSRVFIEKVVKNPEILSDILKKKYSLVPHRFLSFLNSADIFSSHFFQTLLIKISSSVTKRK